MVKAAIWIGGVLRSDWHEIITEEAPIPGAFFENGRWMVNIADLADLLRISQRPSTYITIENGNVLVVVHFEKQFGNFIELSRPFMDYETPPILPFEVEGSLEMLRKALDQD